MEQMVCREQTVQMAHRGFKVWQVQMEQMGYRERTVQTVHRGFKV